MAWGEGDLLAAGLTDGTAVVWHLEGSTALMTVQVAGHDAEISSVSINADGTRLATGGLDGRMKVWDLTPGATREWLTVEGDKAVAISHDGALVAVGDTTGLVTVHDGLSGAVVSAERVAQQQINALQFDPTGTWLASGSHDGTAALFRVGNWAEGRQVLRNLGHVRDVAFDSTGRILATASWPGEPIRTWAAATGSLQHEFDTANHADAAWPESVAFSRDGKWIAGGTFSAAYVWPVDDPWSVTRIGERLVNAMAFDPAGRLVTGGMDGAIKVWDATTGQPIGEPIRANLGRLVDLEFSPDGSTMATTSTNGAVRLWDAKTLEPRLVLARDGAGKLAFSGDGSRLAYAAIDGRVRVIALRTADLLDLARARLH
jgi:WD40 repeat protein